VVKTNSFEIVACYKSQILATKPLSAMISEPNSFRPFEHTGRQKIPMPVLIASDQAQSESPQAGDFELKKIWSECQMRLRSGAVMQRQRARIRKLHHFTRQLFG
jgi:hypothetical protein